MDRPFIALGGPYCGAASSQALMSKFANSEKEMPSKLQNCKLYHYAYEYGQSSTTGVAIRNELRL
jgi:hypothetical protein